MSVIDILDKVDFYESEIERLTLEIKQLEFEVNDKSLYIQALEESGIDNWCNYEYAIELYKTFKRI